MKKVVLVILAFIFMSLLVNGCAPASTPISPTMTASPIPPTFTPQPTATATATPLPTSTPYPIVACTSNQNFIGEWTTEKNGMLFDAFLCPDNTLIAIFHNQDFSDTITLNQVPQNDLEYSWDVYIDIDANDKTGTPKNSYLGIPGLDFSLSLSRFSNGAKKVVPITDAEAFQINVWKLGANGGNFLSNADWYADVANKTIILKGVIPGISKDSRILFDRYNLTQDNSLTYQTDYATFKAIP